MTAKVVTFIKQCFFVAMLMIIATIMMSFKTIAPIFGEERQPYIWYERGPGGPTDWTPAFGGNPSVDPPDHCELDDGAPCAKGFLLGNVPDEIDDETDAADEVFRPNP